ncbi:MAG: hypothetical protein C0448_10155 [Sphingobacteriaceae bacterium]|nr:hypothetical protein [Sphingobacteriaceae bacterium]
MALYLVTLQCIPRANLNFYWTFTSDILKTNKMKKLVVISTVAIMLLSSCVSQKTGTSSYNDDVYANPKEDRVEEARIAAEKKQAKEAADKRYNDSIAAVQKAQKEKDDANPYYKDREFKYDDYYDYEYATRVRRFNNRIDGLSYYDNYYTNSYWYNPNPYNYGVSVYSGYSWWGPSYNTYSYNPSINFYSNWGWGCNPGYGYYGGYNPYMAGYMAGYNNGFYNGYFGNYYGYGSPYYGYGYGNYGYGYPYYGYGYNNPYNGWGYYNSYDHNSSYSYGPRSSYGGGNSRRTSNPGTNGKRELSSSEKFISQMAEQQVRDTKFSPVSTPRVKDYDNPIRVDNNGTPIKSGSQPTKNDGMTNPTRGNSNPKNGNEVEPVRQNPIKDYDTAPVKEQTTPTKTNEYTPPVKQNPIRNSEPVKQNPIKTSEPIKPRVETPKFEAPTRQNNSNPTPSFPSNNGGGSTPSNNSGGRRPR